jgi:methyl-accepting chemotaxis protein
MGDYSRGIEDVADRSANIATSLGSVAKVVREATSPLRDSASSIEQALLAMSAAVAADARNAEGNREEMREIATALRGTSEAAQTAWSDYRDRFNEVDEALGRALTMLTQETESHAQNLNERVGQVDEALSKGVKSLGSALQPLENLSDTVEDLSKAIQNAQIGSDS